MNPDHYIGVAVEQTTQMSKVYPFRKISVHTKEIEKEARRRRRS